MESRHERKNKDIIQDLLDSSDTGNFISILTTDNARCEGLLIHVNDNNGSFIIENVYCHGTEGRNKKKKSEMKPCNMLSGSILFKKNNIKDLEVIYFKGTNNKKPEVEHDAVLAFDPEFPPITRHYILHH